VALTLNQLQDFVEDAAPEMTKLLAGSTPEFMMRIRVKSSKNQIDVAAANALLSKIQTYWRFEP
jgi:ribosome-associated toxin RatA of RatAB toxin-antitoxin module